MKPSLRVVEVEVAEAVEMAPMAVEVVDMAVDMKTEEEEVSFCR